MSDLQIESAQVRQRLHEAEGDSAFLLDMFGDELAKKQKYRSNLTGIDAVRYYLMQKHNWLPRDVKSMSYEELSFAVSEETARWTLPAKFRDVGRKKR